MEKVNCCICKTEIKVYPYRLKNTKNFYCKDHIKEAWRKYSSLGRIYGPEAISKLAKEGKLPEGTKRALEKGRGWFKGKTHTDETKRKLSISGKNRVLSEEAKRKMIEGAKKAGLKAKGKKHSEETKRKISEIQKGRKPTIREIEMFKKGREKHLMLCKQASYWTEERRKKVSEGQKRSFANGRKRPIGFTGKHTEEELTKMRGRIPWNKNEKVIHYKLNPEEKKEKMSMAMIKLWENNDYRKKVLGKRGMSKLEEKVNKIIQKYDLPYKFVGDGKFHIERKVPDFININGEKKAVEVYWSRHKEQFRNGGIEGWKKNRINIFKKYGWEIIFIEGTALTEQKVLNLMQKGGE